MTQESSFPVPPVAMNVATRPEDRSGESQLPDLMVRYQQGDAIAVEEAIPATASRSRTLPLRQAAQATLKICFRNAGSEFTDLDTHTGRASRCSHGYSRSHVIQSWTGGEKGDEGSPGNC